MSEKQEIERSVLIESVAQGGEGKGTLADGRVVFVSRALPGETVDVRIEEDRKSFARGSISEIRQASEARIESDCPNFEECGGCQFWHAPYQRELEWKSGAARHALERISGYDMPDPEVTASPKTRGYRNRVRFHRRRNEDGDWQIGYFGRGSHELVEVDECPVAMEPVNRARRQVEPGLKDVGDVDVLVETASDEAAVVSVMPEEQAPQEPPDSLLDFARELDDCDAIRGLRFVNDDKEWVGGDATVDGVQVLAESPVETIRLPAGMFRQANPAINRLLTNAMTEAVEAAEGRRVLELFSGVGNLTFPLAKVAAAVSAVEMDDVAVEMGGTMAMFAGYDNIEFMEADLAHGMGGVIGLDPGAFDTVVLDPPRGGAPDVCRELVDSTADTIVYVSCDPPALGRDLETMGEGGWRVQSLRMFDMFPRTAHVEVLAVLERA